LKDPLGIDVAKPRLSLKLEGETSRRLIKSSAPQRLKSLPKIRAIFGIAKRWTPTKASTSIIKA